MIRREFVQKVVFWSVICVLFIKDFFPSLQITHKILDNHTEPGLSENSLLYLCTSALLKALKTNLFYPKKSNCSSLQKCKSPLENFPMVATLVLTIAPCFRSALIKITPRTCMINASTMIISQSFVLKWNFATSKGRFLEPMMSMVPMSDRLPTLPMVTTLPIGSRLPNIGFSAPAPCPLSIFLSRMYADSAPFFSISFNSCAPLVSRNEIELYRLNFVRCTYYYCTVNLLFIIHTSIRELVYNTSTFANDCSDLLIGSKQFDVE